jgi:hypothetical protein
MHRPQTIAALAETPFENNFDDLIADITFFLIASPLAGAVLGVARVLTETNNGSKLLPIKLNSWGFAFKYL